ncbi:uncharacterized protein CMU_011820 [Cryptosporidium muris RN66]|uniref:Uncharacterized protein n=1 Tax=Cryptosporidium muris (strain RN66) TaxID=441375 RepID=B6AJ39_CRYMR|nr:uncharacterized protein CMU_011820 [Cryptosporidium muris RN66]EEA08230.1 hypothetical protein, conserved [Cryptosporidium muris RN66]|eukprot:XP_002142579.1 hypothetical protein [Cryptosporidium muris RN66]
MELINGSQIDKSSIALLASHLITNFMTKQEFLEECKVQLPIHKPYLNKSEVYLLCLNALKEVSRIIGESSSGKLLSKDKLPNITENIINFSPKEKKEKEHIIRGYERLLDQVVDIFYNDLYFDEDLLEEDNDLISNSLKELAINEITNLNNNDLENLKEKSTPTKYSKIEYPKQLYPLAVEVLLTLDYDDLVIWESLPLLLQIRILNNYILYLLIEKKLNYSKFENHKLFVNAFISSMNAPEKLEIPSDEGIREARMELCKLGILYKPGIDIEPFKTLFSVPNHSLDLWKKLPFELQLELLVAFIYSIRNNNDLELNKYLFYNLRKNKFPDGIQNIIKQYLLKKFIIEENNVELAYQHFRKILFYAYKVGMKDLEDKNLEDTAIVLQDPFATLQKINIPNNSEIKEEEAISIAETEVKENIGDTPIDLKKETKSDTLINKEINKNSKEIRPILKKQSKFITDKNNIYSKIEYPQKTLPKKEQKLEATLLEGFNKAKIIKSANLVGGIKSNFQERPDLRIIPVHDIKSNGLKIVDASGFSVIPSTAKSLSYSPKEGGWIINTENNQFEKDGELNNDEKIETSGDNEFNEDQGRNWR